ncbi:MAG: DUF3006 domain-containing protein [Armatimonadota bacterium]
MRAFIDQIFHGHAMLLLGDDESVTVTLPIAWLPAGIREGMVLQFDARIDQAATEAGHAQVQALMDDLGDAP